MALDKGELGRRMRAARELRGLHQSTLGKAFADDGFEKHEFARLERGELPWTSSRARALAFHLRMPIEWFTEPDLDVMLGLSPQPEEPPAVLPAPQGRLGRRLADRQPTEESRPRNGHSEGEGKRRRGA